MPTLQGRSGWTMCWILAAALPAAAAAQGGADKPPAPHCVACEYGAQTGLQRAGFGPAMQPMAQTTAAPGGETAAGWFASVFDTSDFPARWHCGTWSTAHGMTHIISDFAIAGAYAAIPLILAFFMLRRGADVPFLPIFVLFAAFIFFCGFGHFVEAFIFWHPWYRFSAVIKVGTAIVSWLTVLAMLPMLPQALALPGLASTNERLKAEITERQIAEQKLQESYTELQEFASNMIGREERMIELKREINDLLRAAGRETRYELPDNG